VNLASLPDRTVESRSELVPLSESDLAELARFITAESGRTAGSVEAHLRWFLLENPARDSRMLMGWGLRSSADDLVGCILCVPQVFRFQKTTLTLMGSSSFYVDALHRGGGGLIFLQYSRLCAQWALFGNSANSEAAALWKARGAIAIPDSDHELFGVLRWSPITEEILQRKIGEGMAHLPAKVIAPFMRLWRRPHLEGVRPVDLVRLTGPEQVMDLPVSRPSDLLTSARDLAYVRWRYFAGQDPTAEVFSARSTQLKTDVMVAVNQRRRGHRNQIRTLNLLDVYPAVSTECMVMIVSALVLRYRENIDAVVLRGQDAERQAAFQRIGFVRRALTNANGWLLDKFAHLPTRDWYFVPADGDWLI